MPSSGRRSFLASVGAAATSALAGCPGSVGGEDPETASPGTAADESAATDEQSSLGSCGSTPRPEHAWPQPGRTGARDGYVPGNAGLAAPLSEAWAVDPPVPEPDPDYADPEFEPPVVAHGRVYAVVRIAVGPMRDPPDEHYLVAIDTATGEREWLHELRTESASVEGPVVHGDTVYAASGQTLVAVDAHSGIKRWEDTLWTSYSDLRVAGERLYVVHPAGALRALDHRGDTVWVTEFEDSSIGGPVVGERYVYVRNGSTVAALDPDDGTEAWTHQRTGIGGEGSDPLVDVVSATECGVFFTEENRLAGVDHDGDLAWRIDERPDSLVTDGATLYLEDGHGEVLALDAATGEVLWSRSGHENHDWFTLRLVTEDALLEAGAALVARDPADGRVLWTVDRRVYDVAVREEAVFATTDGQEELVALTGST